MTGKLLLVDFYEQKDEIIELLGPYIQTIDNYKEFYIDLPNNITEYILEDIDYIHRLIKQMFPTLGSFDICISNDSVVKDAYIMFIIATVLNISKKELDNKVEQIDNVFIPELFTVVYSALNTDTNKLDVNFHNPKK